MNVLARNKKKVRNTIGYMLWSIENFEEIKKVSQSESKSLETICSSEKDRFMELTEKMVLVGLSEKETLEFEKLSKKARQAG